MAKHSRPTPVPASTSEPTALTTVATTGPAAADVAAVSQPRVPYVGAIVHFHMKASWSTVEDPKLLPPKAAMITFVHAPGSPYAGRVTLLMFDETVSPIHNAQYADAPAYGRWTWIPEASGV